MDRSLPPHLDQYEQVLGVLRQAGEADLRAALGPGHGAGRAVRQHVAHVLHGHARCTGVVPHAPVLLILVVLAAGEVLRYDGLRLRTAHGDALYRLPVLPGLLLVAGL